MQFHVELGLLILSLAFAVSFFGGLTAIIDFGEYWRLIAILEGNPHRYIEYMLNAFLYLILPPAVGLAYSVIAFIRERKSPTGVLKWWLPLTVFGCFFLIWGIYGFQWTYTHYCYAIRWANVDIADLILKVCLAVWMGDILWMFAGVLFMLSPIFKMMLREKGAPTTN
jgi:hypothetical protein